MLHLKRIVSLVLFHLIFRLVFYAVLKSISINVDNNNDVDQRYGVRKVGRALCGAQVAVAVVRTLL